MSALRLPVSDECSVLLSKPRTEQTKDEDDTVGNNPPHSRIIPSTEARY